MVTAQPFAAVHEKNLLFRQTRPVQNRCGAVQTKKHGEALANAGSPWYTVGVERCCRRTVASRDMADYSVKLGRLVDGVIFLLCKKNYFLFLKSRIKMTIEMMAQIAVMRANSSAYVTMRITSRKRETTVRRRWQHPDAESAAYIVALRRVKCNRKKYGEALANAGSPWYTVCVERCCRRTVASRSDQITPSSFGRVLDGVIFLLCKKNYFLFLKSRIKMTIEMMAQIAVIRANSSAYVTMRITSRKRETTVRRRWQHPDAENAAHIVALRRVKCNRYIGNRLFSERGEQPVCFRNIDS